MAEVAFALPVLPGQEQRDRQTLEELAGDRRDEYEAALAEAGVTRHAVWHQETPDGTLAIVYMVADDESGVGRFAASDAPDEQTVGGLAKQPQPHRTAALRLAANVH